MAQNSINIDLQANSQGITFITILPDLKEIPKTYAKDNKPITIDLFVLSEGAGDIIFSSNNLPSGLSIDPITGQITGKLRYGTYSFDVIITDADGETHTQTGRIIVSKIYCKPIYCFYPKFKDRFNLK